jgi:hypothetical protein
VPPKTVPPTTVPAPITTAPAPPPLPAGYGYRPLSPYSPWNTPIDAANATWSDDPILHTISGITYNGAPDPQLHFWVNTDLNGSCPVYHVQPTDPIWTFQLRNPWRGHTTTPFQLQAPATFKAGTVPNGDNPATLIIGNTLHDLYGIIITGPNTATLYGYANQSLTTGTGFGTPGQLWTGTTWNIDPATGTRAANTPWGVGLITQDDLNATTITHALAIALPNRMLTSKATTPATSYDNNGANTGTIPCGTRLAIPPTTAMPAILADPKWNGLGTKFWNVIQTYGIYVVDGCGGAWPILYTDTISVTNPTQINPLYAFWNYPADTRGLKQSILDHINPHLRIAK